MDPTLNPITRRPGPGRGRPKKQLLTETAAADTETAMPSIEAEQPHMSMAVSMATGLQLPAPSSDPGALAVDPSLEEAEDQLVKRLEEANEHIVKRPRLEESQNPSLEDEAVMNALAAHHNPVVVDQYAQEYVSHACNAAIIVLTHFADSTMARRRRPQSAFGSKYVATWQERNKGAWHHVILHVGRFRLLDAKPGR
jgi:hypothetical protein